MNSEKQKRKIFISHSYDDTNSAVSLCSSLESDGYKCWIAPRDVLPGMSFQENASQVMEECMLVVLVYSKSSQDSKCVKSELNYAFHSDIPVIPVRLENVIPEREMEFLLGTFQWIEAFEKPFEEYFPQIISAVNQFCGIKKMEKKDTLLPVPEAPTVSVDSQPVRPEGSPSKPKEEKNKQKTAQLSEPEKGEPPSQSPQEEKKEIFISFQENDESIAQTLCEKLESCDYHCWMFTRDSPLGRDFPKSIIDAINQCSLMVVIYSENAKLSKYVDSEINLALERKKPILPLLINDVKPSEAVELLLGLKTWLPAYDKPFEHYFPRIISAIKELLRKEN